MYSFPPVTVAPVKLPGKKAMRIPIQLLVSGQSLKTVDSRALINSGADISCIDWDFVKKHQLPTT